MLALVKLSILIFLLVKYKFVPVGQRLTCRGSYTLFEIDIRRHSAFDWRWADHWGGRKESWGIMKWINIFGRHGLRSLSECWQLRCLKFQQCINLDRGWVFKKLIFLNCLKFYQDMAQGLSNNALQLHQLLIRSL